MITKLGEYRNGNYDVTIYSDGTKIRKTNDDEFIPSFPESVDLKTTSNCSVGCSFCYDGATPNGKHGDLSYNFLRHLHPYTEMAINGNDLNHPQLLIFLHSLKKQKVFANVTVNQVQFEKHIEVLRNLVKEQLIWGLGISLVNPTDEFISKVKEFDNAVIHTIAGLLNETTINKLANHNLKLLVLGYKVKGRGDKFYSEHKDYVDGNIRWLNDNLSDITKMFRVISFDNLAITQLNNVKVVVGEKWDKFYMGDDGEFTFYIDTVNGTFAKNSCIKESFPISNKSIDEMFNFIRERY